MPGWTSPIQQINTQTSINNKQWMISQGEMVSIQCHDAQDL